MDCETARQWLEACRSNSGDLQDPRLTGHLEQCADCRAAWHATAMLDVHIGARVRQVAVPPGLKERLLQGLQSQQTQLHPLVHPAAAEPPIDPLRHCRYRSKWFWASVAATAAAATLLVVWLDRFSKSTPWTVANLQQKIEAVAFDDTTPAGQPAVASPLNPSALNAQGRITIDAREVSFFRYVVDTRGGRMAAELYVVARSEVAGLVPHFSGRILNTSRGMTVAVWSQGDYVCVFVTKAARGEELLRMLRPSRDFT